MGTPTEDVCHGCTSLPDYKPSFPKWKRQELIKLFENSHPAAIDLLEKMLIYEPAQRISAREALNHSYFSVQFDN